MGKSVQLQQHRKIEQIKDKDEQIRELKLQISTLLKIIGNSGKGQKKMTKSYSKRIDQALENVKKGKVLKFKNIEEFAEKFGYPQKRIRPKFERKINTAVNEANEGRVTHYKNIAEFDRKIRTSNKKRRTD